MNGSAAQNTKWKPSTLGEISTDIAYGYTACASNKEVGPKFLRITDIQTNFIKWDSVPFCQIDEKKLKNYILDVGDVVIARTGNSTGATAVIKEPVNAVFASYLIRYKLDPRKAHFRFIDFVLRSPAWSAFVKSNLGGSAQSGANAKVFAAFPLLLPPLPEQKAIAAVLSSLDDKIELLRRQNKTLEKIAQTIFKEWFVEFDFPDKNGKPYKASGGKMVDSDLGPIPKGWVVGNLSGLVDHATDTVSPSQSPSEEFWHYSIPAYDNNKTPSKEKGGTILSNKFLVPDQVVLVSKLNPKTPRIWLVLNHEANSICSSEFQVIRPKHGTHLSFIYSLLRSEDVTRKLSAKAQGTSSSHQRIRPDDILGIKLPIPESHVLELCNAVLKPILRKTDRNLKQTWSLMALRDTLLIKLMNGDLRVS